MINGKEIKTIEEFMRMKQKNVGFVVITDTYNPTRIHRPSCSWVSLQNFSTKVIENMNYQGHYYWVESIDDGESRWSAFICSKCLKVEPENT